MGPTCLLNLLEKLSKLTPLKYLPVFSPLNSRTICFLVTNCNINNHINEVFIIIITGNTCNTCRTGFYGLTGQDPLGCKECNCDPHGTEAGRVGSCDAVTGDCSCKPGVIGRNCGQCSDGFHGLTQNGCSSCNCSAAGTPQSLVDKCDKDYGNCSCKLNVEGNNCDKCKPGFYNLMQSNRLGCTQCSCDTKGTVGGSGECDQQSGNCTCKRLVIGQQCNQCMLGTFGLNQSDPDGCRPCGCHPKGTVDGDTKSSGKSIKKKN